MDRKEWMRRGDEVLEFPFVVVYANRAVWPACDYFKNRTDADNAAKIRPAQNIQERRWDAKGEEQSRLLWGSHPSYGTPLKK